METVNKTSGWNYGSYSWRIWQLAYGDISFKSFNMCPLGTHFINPRIANGGKYPEPTFWNRQRSSNVLSWLFLNMSGLQVAMLNPYRWYITYRTKNPIWRRKNRMQAVCCQLEGRHIYFRYKATSGDIVDNTIEQLDLENMGVAVKILSMVFLCLSVCPWRACIVIIQCTLDRI